MKKKRIHFLIASVVLTLGLDIVKIYFFYKNKDMMKGILLFLFYILTHGTRVKLIIKLNQLIGMKRRVR